MQKLINELIEEVQKALSETRERVKTLSWGEKDQHLAARDMGRIYAYGHVLRILKDKTSASQYKYCTIKCDDRYEFTAKVHFSEISNAWEPEYVLIDGEWVSADFFESTEHAESYRCEDYRNEF